LFDIFGIIRLGAKKKKAKAPDSSLTMPGMTAKNGAMARV